MTPLTRNRAAAITSIGLLALVLSSCASTTPEQEGASSSDGGYPVTVTSCGVDYTYEQAPDRALVAAPGVIKTLDALGVADSVIGYTLADRQIEGLEQFADLAVTTSDWTPSREFLISAQPDFFLSNDEQQLLGEGAASKDDLAGIPSNLYVLGDYCVDAPAQTSIDVVYEDIERLGAIYGVPEAASDLIGNLQSRVAAAAALNPGDDELTAGAITVFDGKVYALSGTYYAAALGALDLTNGFADLGANFAEITTEAVLASDLDIILVVTEGGDLTSAVDEARRLFANAPAVQNDRVVGVDGASFESAGVIIIDVIEEMAAKLF